MGLGSGRHVEGESFAQSLLEDEEKWSRNVWKGQKSPGRPPPGDERTD